MNESPIQNIDEFTSFNDFFTRKLAPTARTINLDPNLLVSPADGNRNVRVVCYFETSKC